MFPEWWDLAMWSVLQILRCGSSLQILDRYQYSTSNCHVLYRNRSSHVMSWGDHNILCFLDTLHMLLWSVRGHAEVQPLEKNWPHHRTWIVRGIDTNAGFRWALDIQSECILFRLWKPQ
ncbi:hypothetical protein BU24DRAFT_86014 [Aaosphaeria arxii CBS 175.79]|uniref:Heterokaryon incompatibility domain-containing protein n=1 Tax=Aaosphaeria arxii CBS 175.79 TaxID=1450172 RepID=A0A6A5X8J8_9PLEO|nr:uncharacterized protein BU24DRAFT_86014 [Aaosphaeria arxii CBS 175.79]KAF2009263.1 hypothetical protein BU24DRAFT_86014 [Aaosphaeria arxii CBS 175.79]